MPHQIRALALALCFSLTACGSGSSESETEEVRADEPHAILTITSGEATPYGSALGGAVPALVAFDLGYVSGDHHVSSLAAGGMSFGGGGPDPDSFFLMLNDDDNGPGGQGSADPVRMSVKFCDLRGITVRHLVTGKGLRGAAELPMVPAPGPGDLIVLCGFSFQSEGSNHHIQEIEVSPNIARGVIEVQFEDSTPDDDTYAAQVAYAIIPAARHGSAGGRPYFVGPYRDTNTMRWAGNFFRGDRGRALMSSFSFRRPDGDRHLQRIAVDLEGLEQGFLAFHDADGASTVAPLLTSVGYVVMRE